MKSIHARGWLLLAALALAPTAWADGDAAAERAWQAQRLANQRAAAEQERKNREARERANVEATVKANRSALGSKAVGKSDAEVMEMSRVQQADNARLSQKMQRVIGNADMEHLSPAEQQALAAKMLEAMKSSKP